MNLTLRAFEMRAGDMFTFENEIVEVVSICNKTGNRGQTKLVVRWIDGVETEETLNSYSTWKVVR